MIKRIKVYQYRCFHSLELELMHHHVLAGANDSNNPERVASIAQGCDEIATLGT